MLHKHARPAVAGNYLLGAVVGAIGTASLLLIGAGLLSPIPATLRAGSFLTLCSLLGLHLARVVCLPLPQRAYQIPRETFNGSAGSAAFAFAAELGLGFRTYVPAASPYALLTALLLVNGQTVPQALVGAVAAAVGFGLGRARIVVGHSLRGVVAVNHPAGWLRAADLVSLLAIASVGIRQLLV